MPVADVQDLRAMSDADGISRPLSTLRVACLIQRSTPGAARPWRVLR